MIILDKDSSYLIINQYIQISIDYWHYQVWLCKVYLKMKNKIMDLCRSIILLNSLLWLYKAKAILLSFLIKVKIELNASINLHILDR